MLGHLKSLRQLLTNSNEMNDNNDKKVFDDLSEKRTSTVDVDSLSKEVVVQIEDHAIFQRSIMSPIAIYQAMLVNVSKMEEDTASKTIPAPNSSWAKDTATSSCARNAPPAFETQDSEELWKMALEEEISSRDVERSSTSFTFLTDCETITCKQCGNEFSYERKNVGQGGIFSCPRCGNSPYVDIFYGDSEAHKVDTPATWSVFNDEEEYSFKRLKSGTIKRFHKPANKSFKEDDSEAKKALVYTRLKNIAETEIARFCSNKVNLDEEKMSEAASILVNKTLKKKKSNVFEDPNEIVAAILLVISPDILTTKKIVETPKPQFKCCKCSKDHFTMRSSRICCMRRASFGEADIVPVRRRSSSSLVSSAALSRRSSVESMSE